MSRIVVRSLWSRLDLRYLTSRRVAGQVALMVVGLSVTGSAQSSQRYTLSGGDVAIWNLVGSMRVEGSSGRETEVEVTRRGADSRDLRVETGRLGSRETLRVVYPDNRILFQQPRQERGRSRYGEERTTLRVNDDGTFSNSNNDDDRRSRSVVITSSGSGLDASAEVRIRVPRGIRVAIYLAAGEASVTNVDGDVSVDVHEADLTTSGTRGTLSLDTGSGTVDVSDADGELSLDLGSGTTKLSRVRGSKISLDIGSGGIDGSDLTADHLSVDGGSGRVTLRNVRSRDIGLDTGSGSLALQLASDVDRLMIDTGSGGVTIDVPESLGATVEAETGSGGVNFDFPVEVTHRSRGHLTGQIGDGRGRIVVDAGSGSVRFRRTTSSR